VVVGSDCPVLIEEKVFEDLSRRDGYDREVVTGAWRGISRCEAIREVIAMFM